MNRGKWNNESTNKTSTILTSSRGPNRGASPVVPNPTIKNGSGESNSGYYLNTRNPNTLSNKALEGLSEYRQEEILSYIPKTASTSAPAPKIVHNVNYKSLIKTADIMNTLGNTRTDTTRLAPEVYSPLFQIANLQLPRDRITMNAWNRNFYDTHPLVHNCINLHATYPISKINIKCPNRKVEQFFNDMCQEMDIINILNNVALEYFKIGEAFPYAELNEEQGIWSSIRCLNPDYIHIKQTVVGGDPIISMSPDAALQRLVMSNNPADVQLKSQIPEEILYQIRKGNNIPLDNFHVSHLKLNSSPYDLHGTSIIVSVYKDLMLYDKLREAKFAQADGFINPLTLVKIGGNNDGDYRATEADLEKWRHVMECHDEETEVLTSDGFKKYNEVIDFTIDINGNYISKPKDGIEIACFNAENEELEYHIPSRSSIYDYNGEMYHFKNEKIDMLVTPNHDMWVSEKEYIYNGHRSLRKTNWSKWKKIKAKDLNLKDFSRMRSKINWVGEDKEFVEINNKKIPITLYLEFLGYLLSEGCLYSPNNGIILAQTFVKYKDDMSSCFDKIATIFNKKVGNIIRPTNGNQNALWEGRFSDKALFKFLYNEICDEKNRAKSPYKRVPRWVLSLKKELLEIILEALVKGDGSILPRKNGIKAYSYYTTSKQLADDVFEMVYKCGYVPTMFIRDGVYPAKDKRLPIYTISWSNTIKGEFPQLYRTYQNSQTKEKTQMLTKEDYNGKVWCFTVPTGLFITRRNGKIIISGNSSQYDKDFKIISHAGVDITRIGASGQIIDTAADFAFIMDNILYGLMTPKAVITQEGSSYNTASIGLEVLKQRYENFRNLISQWLVKKVFAPISEIQGFYEYKDKVKKLIVPEIEWNSMILFDMNDYIQNLKELAKDGKVSNATLFKSLGLNEEQERRKVREELIKASILQKETDIIKTMDLAELRSLNPDDDIIETTESALPGTTSEDTSKAPESAPDLGIGDLGLGGGTEGATPTPESAPTSETPAPTPTATPAPAPAPTPTT